MEKRICKYRNCQNELAENKRKDAIFCCYSCRKMEQTYRKRKAKLIEKWKQNEEKKVELYKFIQNITKEGIQN